MVCRKVVAALFHSRARILYWFHFDSLGSNISVSTFILRTKNDFIPKQPLLIKNFKNWKKRKKTCSYFSVFTTEYTVHTKIIIWNFKQLTNGSNAANTNNFRNRISSKTSQKKKKKKKRMVVSQSYIIKNLNHIIKWQIKKSLDQSPKEV